MDPCLVCRRLRQLRQGASLTLAELGRRTGLSVAVLETVEACPDALRPAQLAAISRALGVAPAAILGLEAVPRYASESEANRAVLADVEARIGDSLARLGAILRRRSRAIEAARRSGLRYRAGRDGIRVYLPAPDLVRNRSDENDPPPLDNWPC